MRAPNGHEAQYKLSKNIQGEGAIHAGDRRWHALPQTIGAWVE